MLVLTMALLLAVPTAADAAGSPDEPMLVVSSVIASPEDDALSPTGAKVGGAPSVEKAAHPPANWTEMKAPERELASAVAPLPMTNPSVSADPLHLPSAPSSAVPIVAVAVPRQPKPHQFFDRANTVGFAIHAAVRTADTAQTCLLLSKGGRQETWLPMKSCAAIATYSLSMVPAQLVTSYMLHKRGHHKLERFMPYAWAAPSAMGFALSLKAW